MLRYLCSSVDFQVIFMHNIVSNTSDTLVIFERHNTNIEKERSDSKLSRLTLERYVLRTPFVHVTDADGDSSELLHTTSQVLPLVRFEVHVPSV